MKKVPVLVLAFNRVDHIEQSMKAIQEYRPERLYLECDGARQHKDGEVDAVEATRKKMLEMVTWPCEVKTLFREENLGCAKAVFGAVSWFFENEEYGIIVEDDIILSQDFFHLCEELLPRYKDCEQVMHINSQNYAPQNFKDCFSSNEYTFAKAMYCWGWASWARAWNKMDMSMHTWPKFKKLNMIKYFGIFKTFVQIWYWHGDFSRIKKGISSSWATRWNYSIVDNNGLCISPCANLSMNIGMDGGTHYARKSSNPYRHLKIGRINGPLSAKTKLVLDKKQLLIDNKDFFRIRMIGLMNKIKGFFL